jgi:MOSC domain-containing protein YiiM
VVEVTGLRTPCSQMDGFRRGLKKACVGRDQSGTKELRAGVMGIALAGGTVRTGDAIEVGLPQKPWSKLQPV